LGLHEATHDPKTGIKRPVGLPGGHSWDDGVVGAFAGSQRVGVFGIQAEVVAPILQAENPNLKARSRAKAHIVAVDKRARISIASTTLK
jgi:hypothetical protein